MARLRRNGRDGAAIWPGFVDAMGSLLIVLIFLLTVFMIVQSVLRDTITQQDSELDSLSTQVSRLADALGLETERATGLETDLASVRDESKVQGQLIATLTSQLAARQEDLNAAEAKITGFEAQVLALLAERDTARAEGQRLQGTVEVLEATRQTLMSEQEAMSLALAKARSEIDATAEAARLNAAQREALEAMVAEMRRDAEGKTQALSEAERKLAETSTAITEAETKRLAELAAAEALRKRLEGAETELTAMTLALEEQRKAAEATLTQLAAAELARKDLDLRLAAALVAQQASVEEINALKLSDPGQEKLRAEVAAAVSARLLAEGKAEAAVGETARQAQLVATAEARLSEEQARSAAQARQVALLNEQVSALRAQLAGLQDLLSAADAADSSRRVQLDALGTQLNTALAQVAAEQKRRAELEEAERQRLEAETKNLERFRSEFFGQLRDVLAGREGVRVVGDRFVFSSEVLFKAGAADLAPEGEAQIARVAATLREAAAEIPDAIDWILRVDGHTDNVPLSGFGEFKDNWELSQARALSVVRYMQRELGFPPERLAATGFGEYRPVAAGDSAEARAQNRRIELKLTER